MKIKNSLLNVLMVTGSMMVVSAAQAESMVHQSGGTCGHHHGQHGDWRHAYGPYVGGNIGIAHLRAKTQANFAPAAANSDATRDYFLSDMNVGGDLRFGWDFPIKAFPRFVLGAEGLAGLSALNAKDTSVVIIGAAGAGTQVKTTLRERYNFGLAAKLGYLVNPAITAYIKLGARISNFKFTGQDIENGAYGLTQTQKITKTGFEPGIGFDYRLSDKWSVNSEYSYTIYRRMKLNNADGMNNGLVYSTKSNISRFMLGVIYRIDYK